MGVVVAALLVAGCSDDTDTDAGDSGEPTSTVPTAELLGEPNAASGEPVKVGLITDGPDCAECSATGGQETPVAEATVSWVNDYLGGLAGRPIDLVVCETDLDPAKASDCANELIADDVVAVVIGSSGVIESSWNVLQGEGIPVVNFSATQAELLEEPDSTFILQDPLALTVELPLEVAKAADADMVSVIVVDLPIATEVYDEATSARFEDEGIELDVVPVPLGTPDMTPQAQQVVSKNPDGIVGVIGHDQFCIPAINGLKAAGFTGTVATISHCVTDAAIDAYPADILDGMVIAATAPLGDETDFSMQQYRAVLDEYDADVDPDEATPLSVYSSISGLALGTRGLQGEVTPESVIAALRAMPNEVLPGTGGRHFRCDGQASAFGTAICMSSLLSARLDADGNVVEYEVVGDDSSQD